VKDRSLPIQLVCWAFLPLFLSGCSLIGEREAQYRPLVEAELFLSRASLGDAEFEHLKISEKTIFIECGKLRRTSHFPAVQTVRPLTKNAKLRLQATTTKLFNELDESSANWDPPGKSRSLSDPGQVKLTMDEGGKRQVIHTSLDSISDPRSGAARTLRDVVRTFRAISGGELCGNKEFYGIQYLQ
jgi:hypothetical protein